MIRRIEYFDFMKAFFSDAAKFKKIVNSEKERYYFMLIRVLSKKHPVEMHEYSKLKAHWSVVDSLHELYRANKQPGWAYGGDKGSQQKLVHEKYDKSVLEYVMKITKYELKAIEQMSKQYPEVTKTIFDDAKKVVKVK